MVAPENADALAAAHKPYPAALEAAPAGPVAVVHLTLKDVVHEVAPGIKYSAWAFSGGAPGPVIHVRQGQTVDDDARQRRRDPALDRLPRRAHRAERAFGYVPPGKSIPFRFARTTPASSCTTTAPRRC